MSELHFLRPEWFLALPVLLLLLYGLLRRQLRSRNWQAVCEPQLLPHLLLGRSVRRANWPFWLLLAGLLLTLIPLAGPVWQRQPQPLFRQQSALVILFDLSRSMQANDLTPSRFMRARLKLADLLRQRREGQTALIVFAADAFTVTPLTEDRHTIEALLSSLEPGLMPAQGSDPERAIELGLKLLQQAGAKNGRLLLVTDADRPARAAEAALRVAQGGYALDVLGVGTAAGGPILLEDGSFFKDSGGNVVLPQLNRSGLAELARAGGGDYNDIAIDDSDLRTLLSALDSRGLDRTEANSGTTGDRWREEGIWLLWPLCLLAALAFRRGWLLVLTLLLLPHPVRAMEWIDLWQTPDQQAASAFAEEDYPRAAKTFEDPRWKAAALYRDGRFAEALQQLPEPSVADDWYNRGNAQAKEGAFAEALESYQQALELNEQHLDARFNKGLVDEALRQQMSQKQHRNQASDQENQGDEQDRPPRGDNASSGRMQSSEERQADAADEESDKGEAARKEDQGQNDSAQAASAAERDKGPDSAETAPSQARDGQEEADPSEQNAASSEHPENQPETPEQRAARIQLEQIPDDPGGLLRRKFIYQYRSRGHQRKSERAW